MDRDPLDEMPAESRSELVEHLRAVLGVDVAAAEDLVRSAQPFWDAMERAGGLVDSWGGGEFCSVLPRVLTFIQAGPDDVPPWGPSSMAEVRRPRRTPESRRYVERVEEVTALTSRLNVLPFDDAAARAALLDEIFGGTLPASVTIYPPFYTEHGLNTHFGEQVFVNQGCTFMDGGGIWIGDRVMIGPKVNLVTGGHPTDPAERRDGIVEAPIVVERDVWIGAAATILPGVRIGHDAVIGAGAVVAKDVAPATLVTGPAATERKRWDVDQA